MNSRVWVNLALAALAIALLILVWIMQQPAQQAGLKLSTLAAADITRIRIDKPGQAPILLEKNPTGWRLTAPFKARADNATVGRAVELAGAGASQRFPAEDLGRFQLDRALLRVQLNNQEFSFGTQNPITGEVYVATGGFVHLIPPRYLFGTLKMPADFASREFLGEQEQLAGFSSPGLTLAQSPEGRWSASPAHPEWGQDDINRWADEWRHASSLVTQPYDGTPPLESFKLQLRDGKVLACRILQREPELVVLREDENLQYHFPAEVGKRLLQPGK